jgi:hypothetical protein
MNRNLTPNLPRNTIRNASFLFAAAAVAIGMAGCRVHVDKGEGGADKNVQVDTPFGGVHVNTNQTSAADLGLPAYPGSQPVADDGKHKSADVHLGFGEWELRVKVVNYTTADSKDEVTAFYKKALGRYGEVLTCQGNSPVGTPVTTSEGLTCAADNNNTGTVQIDRGDYGASKNSLELKAGSKRHQHIVSFEKDDNGLTRFELVALDLPAGSDKSSD